MAKKNLRPATRTAYILMRSKKYSFEEHGYPVTREHDIFTHQTKYRGKIPGSLLAHDTFTHQTAYIEVKCRVHF